MLYHRNTIKALAAVASSDDTRPALQSIRLDHIGGTATDGHILLELPASLIPIEEFPAINPDNSPPISRADPAAIPAAILLAAAKATPKRPSLPILEHVLITGAGETREVIATDLSSWHRTKIESLEAFPSTAALWPKGEPQLVIGLSVDTVLKLFKALSLAGIYSIRLSIRDPKSAIYFADQGTSGARGLLMPAIVDPQK